MTRVRVPAVVLRRREDLPTDRDRRRLRRRCRVPHRQCMTTVVEPAPRPHAAGWSVATIVVTVVGVAGGIAGLLLADGAPPDFRTGVLSSLCYLLPYGLVGAFLIRRRPDLPFGWLLSGTAALQTVSVLAARERVGIGDGTRTRQPVSREPRHVPHHEIRRRHAGRRGAAHGRRHAHARRARRRSIAYSPRRVPLAATADAESMRSTKLRAPPQRPPSTVASSAGSAGSPRRRAARRARPSRAMRPASRRGASRRRRRRSARARDRARPWASPLQRFRVLAQHELLDLAGRRSWAAARRRSCFGTLKCASALAAPRDEVVGATAPAPGFSVTNAHGVSPHFVVGTRDDRGLHHLRDGGRGIPRLRASSRSRRR